ncbi:autotransporter outer membrane beta-barrel domain-containing protein [Roseomonas sp. F4]
MFLPEVAMAACNVTGGDLYNGGFLTCDTSGVDLRLFGGSPVIAVTDHVIAGGFLNVSTRPTQNSPLDIALTISSTTITSPDYAAVTVSSVFADTDIDLTLDQVTLVSGDNPGAVWVRNEIGGNIVLTASGLITASGTDSPAITATTNDGGVRITNSATITSNGGRGIYADGGYNSTAPVTVSVTNSGTIDAYAAGIRVIGYNGLASINNSGQVTSTTLQGLIAWTPNGTVEIVNSGQVTADAHIGVQGAADSGNVSITNTSTGRVDGQRGVVAATDSGTVRIDNAGTITATGNAIETGNTASTVINSGAIQTRSQNGTAIAFGTGNNTLVILPGSTITGLVTNGSVSGGVETIGVNTLTLGGAGGSFDVSQIGPTPTQRGLVLADGVHTGTGTADGGQYRGFSSFNKTGPGTWNLTYGSGAGLADQNWVISEGTLVGNTTTLRGSAITNNASLVFDQASNGTFAGSISGTGNLQKNGAGTLILTGTNTYTGGTYINEGTLQVGNGGTSGSLIGTIYNNANLVFNRSDSYLFPGTITGSGSVSFAGGGTVVFEQADAYSGPVTVGATNFILANGSTSGSTYTIGAQGTISGSGTISGLVINNGGTAAPGYSPGTLSVAGNVTFNPGSTYQVEVWTDGTHDRIAATGTATINGGTVAVVAQSGYMTHLARYEILTAGGGVSGAFDATTSNLAYLTPVLGYEAGAVVLTLARNDVAFRDYATTRNQTAAADAIQTLGLGNAVYESVLDLTTGAVPAALDALSGELHAAVPGLLSQQSRFLREAVSARLRDDRLALAGTQSALDGRATAWIQGFGDWSHLGGNGNAGSITSNVGGVFIGLDQQLDENWKAGVVLGVSRTGFHANTRNSSGNADNLELGAYLGGQYGALNLQLGASYAWHDVDTKRHIVFPNVNSTARGSYGANTAQVFGEASFRIDLNPVRLMPYLGLAYVNTGGEAFTETGSSAALSGKIGSLDTAYSTLGLRSEAEVTLWGRTFRPQASFGWQHAIGDVAGTARLAFDNGGAGYQVSGVPIARDAAIIGAGLSYDMAPGIALNLSYRGQFGQDAQSNGVRGTLSLAF